MRRTALTSLQLAIDHWQFIRRVLSIEHEPVEAGPCQNLHRHVAGQDGPEADLKLTGQDGALEGVDGDLHRIIRDHG
jgi:hypothetical protein